MLEQTHASTAVDPIGEALESALQLDDERGLDPTWSTAFGELSAYLSRPSKRVRPALLLAGYRASNPSTNLPPEVFHFAAALELLHGFMLVHDDVADRAPTRRGLPALHHVLAPSPDFEGARLGEQLAVVAGDHLFALAIEKMLTCGARHAVEATTWVLGVCRHTAVGQYLDLAQVRTPIPELTLFETIRVAQLKTAKYGFVAPLVCGAMLAGANARTREALSRAGRQAGTAFQLRDDLIGLFGDHTTAGKCTASDFLEGKRTFPLIAAWTRADAKGRAALEALWEREDKSPEHCDEAKALVRQWGGEAATQRAIDRLTRSALKTLSTLPAGPGRLLLEQFIAQLARRSV